jgi:hypothetical protein
MSEEITTPSQNENVSVSTPADNGVSVTAAPPPVSGAGVLFSTNLEDQSTSCWNDGRTATSMNGGCGPFRAIGYKPFKLIEGGIAHSGNKSIQITYEKNEEAGGTNVGIDAEAVNVRSYYYFDQGFDFGQGMKIGRVSSFNSSKGLNDIDIILEIRSAQGGNQCGVTNSQDVGLFFNGAPKGSDWGSVAADFNFQRGRWYAIEYQVVLNTPGQSNGTVTLWIDGQKVATRTGLRIRGSLSSRMNTVKIGGWYSNSAHGNSCANPAQPSVLRMDDIVISKSYIGT